MVKSQDLRYGRKKVEKMRYVGTDAKGISEGSASHDEPRRNRSEIWPNKTNKFQSRTLADFIHLYLQWHILQLGESFAL